MKPDEKIREQSRRTKLRKIDIAIQQQRHLMKSAPLDTPLDQVDEMARELARLTNEYAELSTQENTL